MATIPPGRYFVTGAAGFIGSHMVEALLAAGATVTGYDNLQSGKREWLVQAYRDPKFSFIQADLLDTKALDTALRGHAVVIHLGANTDIPGGIEDPNLDFQNCVVATFNVLQTMRRHHVRNLLFASSSTVFGETTIRPTPETVGPLLPVTQYGAGKMACEGLISAFCSLYDFRSCIFRFGNVLGARMGHGVIHDFIAKLKRDPSSLEILGDGEQAKNYFMVEDCIDGIFHAYNTAPELPCDVFHLGSADTVNVNQIARIVAEEMSLKDVQLRYTGGRSGWPGDVPIVQFDLHKMSSLGWVAQHSSAEAIRLAAQRLLGQVTALAPVAGER